MNLTPGNEKYTISIEAEGSKAFFNNYPAKLWKFENYIKHTHSEFSKARIHEVNFIYRNYQDDLYWLKSLKDIPSEIRQYVAHLKEDQNTSSVRAKRSLVATITANTSNLFTEGSTQNNYYYGDDSRGIKRKNEDRDDKDDNGSNDSNSTDGTTGDSIWIDWLSFLDGEENLNFHKHSPEKHRVIRCGKNVSHLPNLPKDTYQKHVDLHKTEDFPIPSACKDYMDSVIDCTKKEDLKKKIKKSPELEREEDQEAINFLEEIFIAVNKIYMNNQDLDDNESVFNHLFVYSFLTAVATACASLSACKCDFVPGETFLQSMTKQLVLLGQYKDDRYQYKADEVFRLFGLKKIEILLLETSGEYMNSDKVKVNFDHHKGAFGALAVLKTIADLYPYGTVEQFEKVKVFFVHAAGTSVHIWSLSYKKDGIYELWNEESLELKPKYDDKDDFLPEVIRFYWTMKQLVSRTIEIIYQLRDSHIETKAKFRYSSLSPPLLTDIVNPSIIKLTQHDDQKGMADLDPFYTRNGN